MPAFRKLAFALVATCSLCSAAESAHWVTSDDVRITRLEEGFRVEIAMLAPVPPTAAWQVLTDFSGMASFVPNLQSSRVLASQGNFLKIEQRGAAHFGPFSQKFESVREISLKPLLEVHAKQLSGTARHMESWMRLKAEDNQTRLEYRAEIIAETSLPPLIGPAFVRHEMAEQFSAMIAEMVKRPAPKAPTAPTTPPASPVPPPGSKGS